MDNTWKKRVLTKSSVKIVGFLLITGFLIVRLSKNQNGQYFMYREMVHTLFTNEIQAYRPYYAKNIFTEADKVFLYHDLCIERADSGGGVKLVSYNHTQNKTDNFMAKAGPHYPGKAHKWTVHLTTLPRPKTGLDYNAAFFITTTCEGNFHHFWKDSIWGLFGAMKATGMLGSKTPSQLYYHKDLWKMDKKNGCRHPGRYQEILYELPIRKEHISYEKATPRSCYDNAVFGYYGNGDNANELREHQLREHYRKAFSITCPPHNRTRVTIINRKMRTIQNAEELKEAATKAGFDTKIVYLSNYTIREQFKIIMCTDILVGIQGAGLRWIDFMPKKSSLLELIWKHWISFYASQAKDQKRKALTLSAHKVELNLTAYFDTVKNKIPKITKELVSQYEARGPVTEADNHWKYAMGVFDANQFVTKLKNLIP